MKDTTARGWMNTGLIIVSAIAAGVSALHVYRLGVLLRQPWQASAAQPVAVDGLVVSCSMALYRAARLDERGHLLAQLGLWSGVLATLAANLGFGITQNLGRPWPDIAGGALYSGWPAYAFLITAEVIIVSARRGARASAKRAKAIAPASAPVVAEPAAAPRVVRRPAAPQPAAAPALKRGTEPARFDEAVELVRQLVRQGNDPPSARWLADEYLDGNRHSAGRAVKRGKLDASSMNGHAVSAAH